MTPVDITTEQTATATLTPKTAAGKPAKLDGAPTWAIDPLEGAGTLEVSGDGLSCKYVSPDDVPTNPVANVTVTADADLGEGVETISDSIQFTIKSPKASSLGLNVTLEPKT